MKKIKVIEGVAAEYNGEFWGKQYEDGCSTSYGFGSFDKAIIHEAQFCKKATDFTHNPETTLGYNPDYNELKKAKLVKVKKTITIEFEIFDF